MPSDARYDEVADFYVAEVGESVAGADRAAAELLLLVGDVRGSDVLDLACGHGRVSRELARQGARVTGIDLAVKLVGYARESERVRPMGITYVVGDVAVGDCLRPASFDCVVCHFGFSDIDHLSGTLRTVRSVLRPGGRFVFSILHPCFPGWGVEVSSSWPPGAGYFREGWWRSEARSSRIRQAVGSNHRTLSTYVNALVDHGLTVERMAEPSPPPSWLEQDDSQDPVPTFLVVRCSAA
jgi:2-polyprenyl-3-methyl-5-hydroxy-6-metoxy-1,4-benzoquinol methylase